MKKDAITDRLARLEALIPQLVTKKELKQELNKHKFTRVNSSSSLVSTHSLNNSNSINNVLTPNSPRQSDNSQIDSSPVGTESKTLKDEISRLEQALISSELEKKKLIVEKEQLETENQKLGNSVNQSDKIEISRLEGELSARDIQLREAISQRDMYKDLVRRLANELEAVKEHVESVQTALLQEKKLNEKLRKEKKKRKDK